MNETSIHSESPVEPPGQAQLKSEARGPGRSVVKRVLVVEDEPNLLELVRLALEAEGYSVVGVNRPESALDMSGDHVPDLALVDLTLPTMRGTDLARRLRANGLADVPMIAMSASPFLLEAAWRTQLFQDTLSKPFDLGQLVERVAQFGTLTPEPALTAERVRPS